MSDVCVNSMGSGEEKKLYAKSKSETKEDKATVSRWYLEVIIEYLQWLQKNLLT